MKKPKPAKPGKKPEKKGRPAPREGWVSKVALAALTHHAALEFAEYNVRVHAVCTGLPYMATTDDVHEDIVTAVLALCGPDYARLTGQIINIS